MEEIWLPVVGYENYYEISSLGNVRSLERVVEYELKTKRGIVIKRHLHKPKKLKTHIGNVGYYTTDFQVNKIKQTVSVHRLIAEAFIPNPDKKATVNHKDGIKTNISISNLEWATFSENNKHAVDTGLRKSPWTGKFGAKHSRSKPVIQLDKAGNVLNRFDNAREADAKTGASYKHITSCCTGKRLSTGGYCWKFD